MGKIVKERGFCGPRKTNDRLIAEDLSKSLHSTSGNLALFNHCVDDGAAVVIAQVIAQTPHFRRIFLWGNSIGNKGAMAIADALRHNRTVKELLMHDNCFGDEGCVAIALSLCSNWTLRKLAIGANNFSDKGVIALSEALIHNSTVEELCLRGTSIGREGLVAIASAISTNHTIRNIFLDHDPAHQKIRGKIEQLVQANRDSLSSAVRRKRKTTILVKFALLSQELPQRLHPQLLHKTGESCDLPTIYHLLRTNPDMILPAPSLLEH